jgi:tetratricopeptide (TPR) repeat protein
MEADGWWEKRFTASETGAALELYKQALAEAPDDYGLLIRLSEASYRLGEQNMFGEAKPDRAELIRIFREGVDFAEKAMKIKAALPGGYFWSCMNLARLNSAKGVSLETLSIFKLLLDRMDIVEKMDEKYYHGGVARFWGRVIYEVPWILRSVTGHPLSEARGLLEKSLGYEPNMFLTRRYYAELLLAFGEREKARAELERVINTPAGILKECEPENVTEQEVARRLMKELSKDDKGGGN